MIGYPGVSFVAASGSMIGRPAGRNLLAHGTVTLAAGGNAWAEVGVANPGVFGCTGVHPYQIRVYPPNETVPILVKAPTALIVCPEHRSTSSVNPVLDRPGA
jgi:hypothetical protein